MIDDEYDTDIWEYDQIEYLDSEGRPARFKPGEMVYLCPTGRIEEVVIQQRHYDYPTTEVFFGNVMLTNNGHCNGWQLKKLDEFGDPI